MTKLTPRTEARLKEAVRRTLSPSVTNPLLTYPPATWLKQGLTKSNCNAPSTLGNSTSVQVELWRKNPVTHQFIRTDPEIDVTAYNYDPSSGAIPKGSLVLLANIDGDWQILSVSCNTFANKL